MSNLLVPSPDRHLNQEAHQICSSNIRLHITNTLTGPSNPSIRGGRRSEAYSHVTAPIIQRSYSSNIIMRRMAVNSGECRQSSIHNRKTETFLRTAHDVCETLLNRKRPTYGPQWNRKRFPCSSLAQDSAARGGAARS